MAGFVGSCGSFGAVFFRPSFGFRGLPPLMSSLVVRNRCVMSATPAGVGLPSQAFSHAHRFSIGPFLLFRTSGCRHRCGHSRDKEVFFLTSFGPEKVLTVEVCTFSHHVALFLGSGVRVGVGCSAAAVALCFRASSELFSDREKVLAQEVCTFSRHVAFQVSAVDGSSDKHKAL